MKHNPWRGLKKWKQESYFQFFPVLFGGGADLMTMAPATAAGAAWDMVAPQRYRGEEQIQAEPGIRPARPGEVMLAEVTDAIPLDPSDPGEVQEQRILYVNGDLDVVIRSYNPAVPLGTVPTKELLQLLERAADITDDPNVSRETPPDVEAF